MTARAACWLLLALACAAPSSWAHKPSDSYLTLSVSGADITGQWDIALRDLEVALGLDGDGDGVLTWGEVRAGHARIAGYALDHLDLRAGGLACDVQARPQLVDHHSDGAYTVLPFRAHCPRGGVLSVDYRLLFDLDPTHRGLLRVETAGETQSAIFSPRSTRVSIHPDRGGAARFPDFVREGMDHIWGGLDHLLFLVTLLLPVLLPRPGQPPRAGGVAQRVLGTASIVTAFTLAHSVTLTLAVLDLVALPPRVVEPLIAASVVAAALNNLYPVLTRRLWVAAFGFGLVHGFGFAAALADLGLGDGALLWSLFGFNLGVEIGQLCIVLGWAPLAMALGRREGRAAPMMRYGSAAVAAVGTVWLVERTLGVVLFP